MRQLGMATFAALRSVSKGLLEGRAAGCGSLSSLTGDHNDTYHALSIAMDACMPFSSQSSGVWATSAPASHKPSAPWAAEQTLGLSAAALAGSQRRSYATQQQQQQRKLGKQELAKTKKQGAVDSSLRNLQPGIVHVYGSQNNTIITLTDMDGNTQAWASAGSMGFKNARKATTYAAEAAAEKLAKDALRLGFDRVKLQMKGLGQGKMAAVKILSTAGLLITSVQERTPMPHNGCRPPKKRRV
mmetsp:Transcript_3668/g.10614  ORF Transcript_3668/g.10614 Transcript_3668/m.10614 type:complete len:243 (-) Transcript_3668:873-1601(-)|eukprot:CAMPEP_0206137008 /NCGR_PEP_ID=MMETSP1473-20131121/2199_1 /ASSEMBLY_ACC=CAM_ASM_001109 /TAXON_ID=1461547 /ORGANISM="Stichococcus sp, Strain RCC1054" /LENGTH=242 /DNA_ID=CAMNT_0053529889 /DNA_START=108 /DNA_END=836 /DNA_ORIENTATION=-